jgi:hypothetical protein
MSVHKSFSLVTRWWQMDEDTFIFSSFPLFSIQRDHWFDSLILSDTGSRIELIVLDYQCREIH